MAIDPQVGTLVVLGLALVLFLTEWIDIDIVAVLIPVALGVLGILDPSEAFSGFGNAAVLTVAAMFVLSRAIVDCGVVDGIGRAIRKMAAGRERSALAAVVLLVAVPSAFVNNTPTVAVFIPIVLALAADVKTAPSRLLLPLSYAAILGGSCTLIGTSTTLLVSGEVERRLGPGEAIGFFEPLPFGLVLVASGMVYLLLVGPMLLPTRRTVAGLLAGTPAEYVTEVRASEGSPLIGQTIEAAFAGPHPDLLVIEVVRGREILWPSAPDLLLEADDLILVRGRAESVAAVQDAGHVVLPELRPEDMRRRSVTLAELVITKHSPLVGRKVRTASERALRGAAVMAVQRRGSHLRHGIADLLLEHGDTLLVQTELNGIGRLRHSDDFVLVEGTGEPAPLRRRAPLVLAVILAIIVLGALNVVPISFLAVAGVALLIATRCLTTRRAYRSLDLTTLVVMAGTISLGVAMEKTGVAKEIADDLIGGVTRMAPETAKAVAAMAAVWVLTNVLTCLISNLAAAALMLPVALESASALDVSSRPFVMAVVYAASLALATPMGYQTNLLVLGPGGYRFSDFVRVGLPLQILHLVLAVFLLPRFFAF